MNNTNPKVDEFLSKTIHWHTEFEKLRAIVLGFDLKEELKWGVPCYTLNDENVLLIHGFKEYCAFLFFKGALMHDDEGILIQQTENVQASRQIRFTSLNQIAEMEPILKSYIKEAIEIEKEGLKVNFKTEKEIVYPVEFENKLEGNPELKKAFECLTPGRRRAYALFFSAPKQPKTREARIEKCISKIFDGKGLDDQ